MTPLYRWAALGALLLLGCGSSTEPMMDGAVELDGAQAAEALLDRLSTSPRLDVDPTQSRAEVVLRLPASEAVGEPIPLAVETGWVSVGASDDAISLRGLSFALARVDLPPDRMPPRGRSIDDIRLALVDTAPAHIVYASETELRATVEADLTLDWAIVFDDGGKTQLGTETLEGVSMTLRVVLDAGERVLVDVDLSLDHVWQWAGLIELSGLDAQLVARERLPD